MELLGPQRLQQSNVRRSKTAASLKYAKLTLNLANEQQPDKHESISLIERREQGQGQEQDTVELFRVQRAGGAQDQK